jgi:hypothetical protein
LDKDWLSRVLRDLGRAPAGRAGLDQSGTEGQAGQVGAVAVAGLIPDPVQVRTDGADADVQLGGDLRVGAARGEQGDQFPFPGAERSRPASDAVRGICAVAVRISAWMMSAAGLAAAALP